MTKPKRMAKAGDCKVFEFGCPLPMGHQPLHRAGVLNPDLLEKREAKSLNDEIPDDLFYVRHLYRNECAKIEIWRRKVKRRITRRYAPQLIKMEDKYQRRTQMIERRREKIREIRQQEQARVVVDQLDEEIKEISAERTELSGKIKPLRKRVMSVSTLRSLEGQLEKKKKKGASTKKVREDMAAAQKEIDSLSPKELSVAESLADDLADLGKSVNAKHRKLYDAERRLHGNTKSKVRAEVEVSRRHQLTKKRRYTGESSLTVQATTIKGRYITVGEMLDGVKHDNFYVERILPEDFAAKSKEGQPKWRSFKGADPSRNEIKRQKREQKAKGVKRGEKKTIRLSKKLRYLLHFRVNNKPSQWITIPFTLHSPERFPRAGQIRLVHLRRRLHHDRVQYLVQFVVTMPGGYLVEVGAGEVGLDVGWRLMPGNRLRVGYFDDNNGRHGSIELPRDVLDRFDRCEDLQSESTDRFNEARDDLVEWLKEHRDAPKWMREGELKTLAKWRSPKRLARVVFEWGRYRRFRGDTKIFHRMEAWRRQNKLDWTAYISMFRRTIRRRDDFYRKLAAEFRARYHTIYIEDVDFRKFFRKKKDEDKGEADKVRSLLRNVAPGTLVRVMKTSGMKVVKRDAKYTTLTCCFCGHVNEGDKRTTITISCRECKKKYDRDLCAARNLRCPKKKRRVRAAG